MKRLIVFIGALMCFALLNKSCRAQVNQVVNNGSLTAPINFLSADCTYNWVNSLPGIGLPAKGIGNIAAFTALNAGSAPIMAIITVTPTGGCKPISLTITVNPTIPTIKAPSPPLNTNTMYGTPSAPASFAVTGDYLRSGVIIVPPIGFEVSTDNLLFTDSLSLNADNAQLSYINLNPDVIRNAGNDSYSYKANVDNSVQSIKITPVASSTSATIKINGTIVKSGDVSLPVPLAPGTNVIHLDVTAQNGITTKSYIINITRDGSSDATLAALTTNTGSISPLFSPTISSYTATVYTGSVAITPVATNDGATIKVNGVTVPSGAASANIALNNGSNNIGVVVTAQDGVTTKNYNLTVISTRSSNAGLSQLALTPAYQLNRQAGTTNYFTTVGSVINSVQQMAVASDANATIKVNGTAIASGALSDPIPLNATGNTIITTVITAQDGTTIQTYTISINKTSASNTSLSRLVASPISTFTPVAGTNNYTTSVSPTVTMVQISAATQDDNATLTINNVTYKSGEVSSPIPLNQTGGTDIITVATSANGLNKKTYIVTVYKNGGTNIYLNTLRLAIPATVTQALGTTNYRTSVSPEITSVQQVVSTNDPHATIKVNGLSTASGSPSAPIQLNSSGTSIITTIVTSEDGKISQSYTLTISKNGASNTSAAQIALLPGATLTRIPNTDNYTTSVSADIANVQEMVTAADENATIKINGSTIASGAPSTPIALNATGTTTINALITAQDGISKRNITLTISKNGSTNTAIKAISLTPNADLTPVPGTGNYITSVIPSVTSLQQVVIPDDDNATITVNGEAVIAGALSNPITLNPTGATQITTVITAPDGLSTKTYMVTISKNGSTNTNIDQIYLTPSATLTPVAGTSNFTTSINAAVTSVKQTVITTDSHVNVKVNGIPVAIGAASKPIVLNASGNTVITTIVTAQDGTTSKTYTITITRGSNGDLLSPLTANLPPTTVYVRLSATAAAQQYNAMLSLKSDGAANAYVPLQNCVVTPAPLTIVANGAVKNYGTALTDEAASIRYKISGGNLKNGNTINAVMLSFGDGGPATATAGTYVANIKPANAAGSNGFLASNYNIIYTPANLTVVPIKLIISAENAAKDFGTPNPPLSITYNGFVNGQSATDLLTQPEITTPVMLRSAVGQYPITVSGAVSPNYLIQYVPGVFTIGAEHLSIFIPNTFTPNGDGVNDTWNIRDVDAYPNTIVEVFNRQGQKVFSSKGYGTPWDGSYNGSQLPPGTYYYFIKNNVTTISGNVNIIH